MNSAIWWIRKDFRLNDNPALTAAAGQGRPVTPLFILDPKLLASQAVRRKSFLFSALADLDRSLNKKGSRLIVRSGKPLDVLPRVMQEANADILYAEEDYSPYSRNRDTEIASVLPLHLQVGVTIHHPSTVVKGDGTPYTVFTPFSRAWKTLPVPGGSIEEPDWLASIPGLTSDPIPETDALEGFPVGEREAIHRLDHFMDSAIYDYRQGRNILAQPGTSFLSPYLRFGMISARSSMNRSREGVEKAENAEGRLGCQTWMDELIWREFYFSIMYHFPDVLKSAFRPSLRNIPWEDAPSLLDAWQEGRTGYPVVDAAMRQLRTTGWMHNRARMITASFLVKDLLINWQEGERWFMQQLIDGDPAANNGGWQWSAGTGTDAAPYFRIFNPVSQGEKFDPQGEYVRKWVPELAGIPRDYIHSPWVMPDPVQRDSRCRIGEDYPAPIIDHGMARLRTLAAYKRSSLNTVLPSKGVKN